MVLREKSTNLKHQIEVNVEIFVCRKSKGMEHLEGHCSDLKVVKKYQFCPFSSL